MASSEYGHEQEAIAAAHRLAIRAVDQQIRLISAEHQKLEFLVRLGLVIIGGKLVVIGFLLDFGARIDEPVILGLTSGVVLVCVAVMHVFVITVTTGSETRMMSGAGLQLLDAALAGFGASAAEILTSSFASLGRAHQANERLAGRLLVARGLGGLALGAGVAAHLGSVIYILRGIIHG